MTNERRMRARRSIRPERRRAAPPGVAARGRPTRAAAAAGEI